MRPRDAIPKGGCDQTAGHTRGCTTFTMRVHMPGEPAQQMRDVVNVGGFTTLPQYRFVDKPGQKASYPGLAADFGEAFATLRALPCDIFWARTALTSTWLKSWRTCPKRRQRVDRPRWLQEEN